MDTLTKIVELQDKLDVVQEDRAQIYKIARRYSVWLGLALWVIIIQQLYIWAH